MTFVIQTPVSHPSETGPAIQASISDITFRQLHSFISRCRIYFPMQNVKSANISN